MKTRKVLSIFFKNHMNSQRILSGLLFSFVLAILAVFNFLPAIPQSAAYHTFADQRNLIGIPNMLNVFSNLPFVLLGMYGFVQLIKNKKAEKRHLLLYFCTFLGIFLTGLGSSYYHFQPNHARLVWDRIPMTLVFMPLLAITLSETVDIKAGLYALFPLIFLGIFSVIYWAWTENNGSGDLRLYGIVQFYPLVLIPLLIWFFPQKKAFTHALYKVALCYLIAKICEYFDQECLFLGNLISGHSLKHLWAGFASWYIVVSFKMLQKTIL